MLKPGACGLATPGPRGAAPGSTLLADALQWNEEAAASWRAALALDPTQPIAGARLVRHLGAARAAALCPGTGAHPMMIVPPGVEYADPAADGSTWGVKAVGADTSPFTGDGVIVSVLDTGIDAAHPAFAGVEIVQRDFTGEGDGDGHGQLVVLAAFVGIAGVVASGGEPLGGGTLHLFQLAVEVGHRYRVDLAGVERAGQGALRGAFGEGFHHTIAELKF